MGLGWRYRRSYEVVLVVAKKGVPMRWFDTSNRIENILRHIKKAVRNENTHPAEKPVALAQHFIGLHTEPGDTVLDPFCGCGSTGVGAIKMERNFVGIEIHPAYADEARKRLGSVLL
jgi:DNA modification methylase